MTPRCTPVPAPRTARSPAAFAVILSLALVAALPLAARPVSYAGGHMLMADHQSDMDAISYTYSPSFRWSASVGALRVDDLHRSQRLDLEYLRAARLLHRWNGPASQANVFAWGGIGRARTGLGEGSARHVGLQLDYETRRIYTSIASELHEGDGWSHRFDTAAIGWAPYEHDVDRMATWFVLKGMDTSNAHDGGIKGAAMLRLFTTTWWLEAGADEDGKPLANVMFNF